MRVSAISVSTKVEPNFSFNQLGSYKGKKHFDGLQSANKKILILWAFSVKMKAKFGCERLARILRGTQCLCNHSCHAVITNMDPPYPNKVRKRRWVRGGQQRMAWMREGEVGADEGADLLASGDGRRRRRGEGTGGMVTMGEGWTGPQDSGRRCWGDYFFEKRTILFSMEMEEIRSLFTNHFSFTEKISEEKQVFVKKGWERELQGKPNPTFSNYILSWMLPDCPGMVSHDVGQTK